MRCFVCLFASIVFITGFFPQSDYIFPLNSLVHSFFIFMSLSWYLRRRIANIDQWCVIWYYSDDYHCKKCKGVHWNLVKSKQYLAHEFSLMNACHWWPFENDIHSYISSRISLVPGFFLLIWAYVNFTAEWFVINCLPELTGRFFYLARNLDCLRGQIW